MKVLGEDDPDTLNTAANLAKVCYAAGHTERARELCETLWQHRDAMLTNAREKTAKLFDALGEPEKAAALRETNGDTQ